MTRQFLNAKDLSDITGNSESWAKTTIQKLNNDLKKDGYLTIKGKVPRSVFEKVFGIERR